MSFQLGQIVGDYEFVDVLRSSKNVVAYKVRNTLVGRYEVLKIVPGDLHTDPERLERFQREIKIHARLDHPNILAFYNATVLDGRLVMTTALVEGNSVEERLEMGPLPWREAANYASQTLSALGLAHAQGIVHRELTPANLLITTDGNVKLMGFGQAKAMQDPRLTQKGAVVGSLYYMSPEQVRGGETLDGRTDIYALGAVLYEMITGRKVFEGKSHFDIMLAHVNTKAKNPCSVNKDLPEPLGELVMKCLEKDPDARFSSALEFRTALRRISGDVSGVHTAMALAKTPQPLAKAAEPTQATPATGAPAAGAAETKPAQDRILPPVEVPLPPTAVGSASQRPAGLNPETGQQNGNDLVAELAKSDRKAFLVLVFTLAVLLISTMMFSKMGS